jgi:hypothetical protein
MVHGPGCWMGESRLSSALAEPGPVKVGLAQVGLAQVGLAQRGSPGVGAAGTACLGQACITRCFSESFSVPPRHAAAVRAR